MQCFCYEKFINGYNTNINFLNGDFHRMSSIIVKNSGQLFGDVEISGSKNSSLPILAACILTNGANIISNITDLSDIKVMYSLLDSLGAKIDINGKKVSVNCENILKFTTPYELVGKMRASFLIAGALLARLGHARIALPGGCPIGTRPVDLHLKGFGQMGAEISQGHGYVEMKAEKLKGAKIYLDFPSVGATENLIIAAVMADGETVIENAAAEPEIVDLTDFLIKQGAIIEGSGSDTIKITGVKELKAVEHTVIPDRIEAGTFMSAFAMSRGKGKIKNVNLNHIKPVTAKLSEMGVEFLEIGNNTLEIDARKKLKMSDVKTLPFPGFPTDMQAPFTVLLSSIEGTGIIVETVFENRFLHIAELNRMGANIKIDGRTSVVEGGRALSGTKVNAFDLRGGAALVLAGMIANGNTQISGIEHIERGYENFLDKLSKIGGNCYKVE